MIAVFSLKHFRFDLKPKGDLETPAYNKSSTLALRHAQGHSERSGTMRLRRESSAAGLS